MDWFVSFLCLHVICDISHGSIQFTVLLTCIKQDKMFNKPGQC